jgi:WD40 repeat protein
VKVVPREGSAAEARVAFSHDNSMVAIPLIARVVRLLTPGSWEELADLEPPSPQYLSDLAFSPDGGQLAAAAETKQIHLWDLRSIRQQLAAMKLDWNAPPFQALGTNQVQGPITVTVLTVTNEAKTLERRAP